MSLHFHPRRTILAAILATLGTTASAGEILFQDNFETDSSAAWSVIPGYYTGDPADDFKVEWAFDYSQQDYNLFSSVDAFEALKVPPAPHSNGTTKGVKMWVNKDDIAARFAINLFPKGQSFSGNYVLRFDCFMNHANFADQGSGTTEYTLVGLNHLGTQVNWGALASGAIRPDFLASAVGRDKSDGVWFGFTHDGGAAQDLWTWEGTGDGAPKYLAGTAGGVPDLDNSGAADLNEFDPILSSLFPSPPFEAAGMLAKRWVEVEVSQVNDVLTWKLDGTLIATRTNTSAFKSGNIMIGLCDPFPSIAAVKDENWVIIDNVRVERVDNKVITVDTVDNASGAGDGKTSLAEALTQAKSGDTIAFNFTGAGPHVIKTPLGGYPLITQDHLTINGYTQPGSSPNSKGILEGNDAKIQIILDSSDTDSSQGGGLPNQRSTRLPHPGYGNTENAILGVLGADHVTIKGLSFLARQTPGSDEDPSIYCIALVREARGCRVQGNWFGLHPDGKTVKAGSSAVAGFRHRVSVDGQNFDTFSERLTIGTDSDGVSDAAEANILCGHHIALALELPMARISGNYFNVLPDGKTFLDIDAIVATLTEVGRTGGDASVENIENGRNAFSTVIGTDGNGANDANERNIFNQPSYDQWIEFYSNARNTVVAGNHFGVGSDGSTVAKTPTARPAENLIEVPGAASVRFGSNNDGKSESLEGNVVRGAGGKTLVSAGATVLISIRGNTLLDNGFEAFPFSSEGTRVYAEYFKELVTDVAAITPILTAVTNNVFEGTFTPGVAPFVDAQIDLYALDAAADGAGRSIPGRWLGTYGDEKPGDNNLDNKGSFSIDITGLALPAGSKVAYAVTYSSVFIDTKTPTTTDAGTSFTGPLSNAILVSGGGPVEPIRITGIVRDGANVKLTWTGGGAAFKVQRRPLVHTGAWTDVANATTRTATVAADGASGFFRIVSQ